MYIVRNISSLEPTYLPTLSLTNKTRLHPLFLYLVEQTTRKITGERQPDETGHTVGGQAPAKNAGAQRVGRVARVVGAGRAEGLEIF